MNMSKPFRRRLRNQTLPSIRSSSLARRHKNDFPTPSLFKIRLEILTVFLTIITVISASASTYFAYKTINLYTEQNEREHRKEVLEWFSFAGGLLKGISEETKNEPAKCDEQPTGQKPRRASNTLRNATAAQPIIPADLTHKAPLKADEFKR